MGDQYSKLTSEKYSLSKKLYLNGQWEDHVLDPADSSAWAGEMELFTECNINKPAYNGQYDVSTESLGTDSVIRTSYKAIKGDLRVRWLNIYRQVKDSIPVLIEAHMERSNLLYNSVQDLSYIPNQGYSITGYQDVFLLGVDSFKVEGTFVKP